MSPDEANRRAALVFATMAAGASGKRSTYDPDSREWTTHHGTSPGAGARATASER